MQNDAMHSLDFLPNWPGNNKLLCDGKVMLG